MIHPRHFDRPGRIDNPRSARTATRRRIVRNSRARYANIGRIFVTMGAVLALLMGYVVLTSSLTGLSYAVGRAEHQREALQEQTVRLDDRLAELRSDDRLAAIAARLGMRDPQQFAMVRLSEPRVAERTSHFTMLSSLAGLFVAPLARLR